VVTTILSAGIDVSPLFYAILATRVPVVSFHIDVLEQRTGRRRARRTCARRLWAKGLTRPGIEKEEGTRRRCRRQWLNNAVFAGAPPRSRARTQSKGEGLPPAAKDSQAPSHRVVECRVVLVEVDLFVLTSDASPILEARLTDTSFKSENISDTFAFAIEGVEIVFIDGTSRSASSERVASSAERHATRTSSFYELEDRKHSTILRKTRILFRGEHVPTSRGATWLMKCTASSSPNAAAAQSRRRVGAASRRRWVLRGSHRVAQRLAVMS
jgi:hypothetical protein